jgi:hypothetical protein
MSKNYGFVAPHILITLVVMVALCVGVATPALAQGDTGLDSALNGVIEGIVSLVQSVAIGLGVLGLVIWGLGKIARPVFPQLSGLTQNYIPDLLIGIAIVFIAAEVLDWVVGAMGVGSA